MKKRTITLAALVLSMLLFYASCNEKRLDLQPLTPTEASFFTEEDDFNRAVLGTYAKLTDYYWYAGGSWLHGFWLLPGDDITTSGTVPFEIFGTLQPANGTINTFYRVSYQLINRANTVLQKLEQESGVISSSERKNRFRGEVLFLRGYANFLLWNYFGTSPLITKRIQSAEEITQPSSSGTALLDQAIADFTEAAATLPTTWDGSNRGRVTRNSANGMLGKALVFRASVTGNTADYTAAIMAFNALSGLSLMPNFRSNFDVREENNAESLFEYQASQPGGGDNPWLPNDFEANGVGSTSTYWGFYENHYTLFGGAPFLATQKLVDAFEPGDPRRLITLDPATKVFNKYWNTGDQKSQSDVASVNNPRILRYADVLLLKAEALVESGGSTTEAIGLVNQIRTRARTMVAGGTAPANFSTAETSRTQIMEWIRAERLRELAGEEGIRWLDLRRWHLGGKINLAGWDWSSVRNDISFDPARHTLYPIPTGETDLNPNVSQNAGY